MILDDKAGEDGRRGADSYVSGPNAGDLRSAPRHRAGVLDWVTCWSREVPGAFADSSLEHEAATATVGIVDTSYRGVIDLRGEKAGELLSRITSNHPESLAPGRGQLACLLSSKGRLIAAFELFRIAESSFRLVLFEPLRDSVLAELGKYAFLDDVSVSSVGPELAVLSIIGPRAGEFVSAWIAPAELGQLAELAIGTPSSSPPHAPLAVVPAASSVPDTPAGGFELWYARDRLDAVWPVLAERARLLGGRPVGFRALESLRLEHGIPRSGLDFDDQSFPGEVGWERALTYDKCYVGQEVVARMRTYGSVHRRIDRFESSGTPLPPAGAVLRVGEDEAGRVTSAAYSYGLRRILFLAAVKRRFFDTEKMLLESRGETVSCTRSPPA
jgi:folate-binding protein YgfZ